jgi:hypothetical protein
MNNQDDTQLDAAIEALARQEPSHGHVARVLARSGPTAGYGLQGAGYPRPRWVLPVAASLVVAAGAAWQVTRQAGLDGVSTGAGVSVPASSGWGAPEEIDRPVLPPQAYWGMDAFEEWNRLRPGSATRDRVAEDTGTRAGQRRRQIAANDRLAWVPEPTGLPPIELTSIAPDPLVVTPVAPLEDITLAEIPLAPIVLGPIAEEERP